jgi:hypothetical protein
MNVTFEDGNEEKFEGKLLLISPYQLCVTKVKLENSESSRTFKLDVPFKSNNMIAICRDIDFHVAQMNFCRAIKDCIQLAIERRKLHQESEFLTSLDFNLNFHSKFKEFHMFDPYYLETRSEIYAELQKDPKGYHQAVVQLCQDHMDAACAMIVLEYCGLSVQHRIGFEMEQFGLFREPGDIGLRFLMETVQYSSRAMHMIMFTSGFCVLEAFFENASWKLFDLYMGDFVWEDGTFVSSPWTKFDHNVKFRLTRIWNANLETSGSGVKLMHLPTTAVNRQIVIHGKIDQVIGRMSTNDAKHWNREQFDSFGRDVLKWNLIGKALKPGKDGIAKQRRIPPYQHVIQCFRTA